jgi:hypothetical protein
MTDKRRKEVSLIDRAREWVTGSVEALAELFAAPPALVPVRVRNGRPKSAVRR